MAAPSRPGDSAPTFPDQRVVIADDARRFRTLSAADRWREIFALRAWGTRLVKASARRDSVLQLQADEEARWQLIQKELFAHHGG